MSALGLYIKTNRIVLEVNPEGNTSWAHIYGPLLCLRQHLSCCVCKKLLLIPMKSSKGHCRHFMCENCVGAKKKKGGTCSQCAGSPIFVEDIQMRTLLQCFKSMCLFICCCPFYLNIDRSNMSVPKSKFYYIVKEGAKYKDETYSHTQSSSMSDYQLADIDAPHPIKRENYRLKMKNRALRSLRNRKEALKTSLSHKLTEDDDNSVQETFNTEGNEYVEEKESKHRSSIDSEESSDSSSFMKECTRSFRRRSSCHCGMVTPNPRKLAGWGQKCPCYIAGQACFNCHRSGCGNPQKLVVTPSSSHQLLADRKRSLSPESVEDSYGSSDSSDETPLNDSSDEY